MKSKKISFALSLIMILTSLNVPLSQAQNNIKNHWANKTISKWQEEGLLNGDANGSINPDNNITRAEFMTLVNKALKYNKTGNKIKNYKDIKETDWYYNQVMIALEEGYINGTSKTTISPNSTITRQEVMSIISKIANIETKSKIDKKEVKDIDKTSAWARQAVENMIGNGYISGYQGKINPLEKMTRAESITLIEDYRQNDRKLSFKGEYSLGEINKLTLITGDVIIKDTQLQDLIIDKQAKGKIELQNVKINGKIQNNSKDLQIIRDKEVIKEQEEQKYKDGVYEGKAKGYTSEIKVRVTIEKGKISKIEIIEEKEDKIYFEQAKKVIDRIIGKQDLQVDVSSGATISSKGIIYAVQDALDKAENKKEEIKAKEEYKDGEYIGEANGFSGIVKVKVIIEKSKIDKVEVISHSDDSNYMESAKNILQDVKRKQKAEVDIVSGATYSSNGVINAIKDALEQAKGKTKKPGQSEYASKNQGGGGESSSGVAGSKQKIYFTDLKDAEYEGIADGFREKSIKVRVTVSGGKVTKIEVLQNNDDVGYLSKEKEDKLIKSIIDKQSTDVDTMSGATYSSRGLINAVVNALSGKNVFSIESNTDSTLKVYEGHNKKHESVEIVGKTANKKPNPSPNVTVKNLTVLSKLTIKDSMKDGSVTFENVTVDGDILIQGAGEHSVYFKNSTIKGTVIVDKQNEKLVSVIFDGNTTINGKLVLNTPALVKTQGDTVIPNIELPIVLGRSHTTSIDANVTNLDIKTLAADILIKSNSKINNIMLPNNVGDYEKTKTDYSNLENTFTLKIENPNNISNGSNINSSMKVLYGASNVDQVKYPSVSPFIHTPFYDMRVKVIVDDNNRIISVSNDETGVKGLPDGVTSESWSRHKSYWDRMIRGNIFDKFVGKTINQVKSMQMDIGGADTVSGATANSLAIKQAVINAMEGRKSKGFLKDTQTLKANTLEITKGTTTVNFTNSLPNDFKVKLLSMAHTVYNGEKIIQGATLSEDGTTLNIPADLKAGHYFVNIIDENNSYRSPDFEGGIGEHGHYPYFVVKSTATLSFEDDKLKASDNDLKNVYDNIEHIIITDVEEKEKNPTKYRATEIDTIGHHGKKGTPATNLFDENTGEINHNAVLVKKGVSTAIFKNKGLYEIQVEAFGYDTLKFNYVANKTNMLLPGDANVDQGNYPLVDPFIHPPFFNARVMVELDINGKIVSVKDNETGKKGLAPNAKEEVWNMKNKSYWDKLVKENFFDKFKGKTLDEVKAMQVDKGEVDVVTGATANSKAVKQAVINAIEKREGKKFLDSNQTLKVTTSAILLSNANTTTDVLLENTLPSDFELELVGVVEGVYNSATATVSDAVLDSRGTKLTIPTNLKAGHYYINIKDRSEKYRSPDFETGHGTPIHYPYFVIKNTNTLYFNDGKITVSNGDLENIFKNIHEIRVKDKSLIGTTVKDRSGKEVPYSGTSIEPVGHHGNINQNAKTFFNDDGSINSQFKIRGKNIFESGKQYKIELEVWGFENSFVFDYTL